MPIYSNRQTLLTKTNQEIEHFLDKRGLDKIVFFQNFSFSRSDNDTYQFIEHVWGKGDRLYKLAREYYGDKSIFWLIGLFNKKPTDAHYNYGDVVLIPLQSGVLYNEVVS